MLLQFKQHMCMCVFLWGASTALALPVSEATTQQYFGLLDLNDILIQTKNDPTFYRQYAQARVSDFISETEQIIDIEQEQLISEIASQYQAMDSQRIVLIKSEMFETYRDLFKNNHSEESVAAQIDFMSSPVGQSILSKLSNRQIAIQQLYRTLPDALSQKVELQEALRSNINKQDN